MVLRLTLYTWAPTTLSFEGRSSAPASPAPSNTATLSAHTPAPTRSIVPWQLQWALSPSHKPDFSQTEPPVSIPPQPSWSDPTNKFVLFNPWGHLVQTLFSREIEEQGLDVRPSIAVTKAHLKMSELDESARGGEMSVDGKVVTESVPLKNEDGSSSERWPDVEVSVSKAAVEPVWFLPGIAERFGM